ncbi:c-type cytochrome [Terasakiella sp. A23]|uniref:c-type cytochrome n=1 Tax=Terasakiella sp. FCG-A23 TaxID=3080561 RepID=UPI002953713E|nr:c-type cytochrome [Terasakiella sp. A23]MDV7341060.1 c-type cytochrome [Terasakiella sp. A23]
MKTTSALIALGVISAIGIAPVQAASVKPFEVAVAEKTKKKKHPGRKVYRRKTCMACHGKGGVKAILDYPNIAGQNKKYLIKQIEDILSGKRVGSPDGSGKPRTEGMRGALVTAEGEMRISKQEIEDVADYLAGLAPAQPKAPKDPISVEDLEKGKKLYKKKKCQSCHGKDGKKPANKAYPYVAGQKSAYIVAQMTDIKEKIRKNGKSKTMVPFVKKLSMEEMKLIADYLSQVDRSK